jgi:hypothetical protein
MDFILASTVGPGRHAPKEDSENKMNGAAQASAAYWRLINQTYGSISPNREKAITGARCAEGSRSRHRLERRSPNDRGFDKIVDMQQAAFWITSITKETPDFTE